VSENDTPAALDYIRLFRSLPGLYLILDRQLNIHEATEAYLKATLTRREAIVGRHLFDVFPDNPDEPGADGTRNLAASLDRVLSLGKADVMAVQKYDVQRTGPGQSGFEERYWSPINTPLLGDDGSVEWIIHRVEDVTDFVRASRSSKQFPNLQEADVFERAQEVQVANEKLRQADRAKTTFLAHMSHEIRTPLNAILGFSHLALAQNPTARLRDYLTKIENAGDTLLHIVDQVLDLSKIESGSLELETMSFSPEEVIRRIQLLFEEKAAAQGVDFKVLIAPDLPAGVMGDPFRVGQVLTNLVGNALKFTSAGQVVLDVGCARRADGRADLRFEVSDTGIGMTEAQVDHLFEAFSQGDSSMQRRFGGTGLGLRISQLLVQAMGGFIIADSRPGHGTRFTFTLDLEIDADRKAPSEVPAQPSGQNSAAGGNRWQPLAGFRVLVAEDNEVNRQIIEELLRAVNIEPVLVSDGTEALDRIFAGPPEAFSLVLMDVQMPGLDGYEVTRRVRQEARFAALPIIALTAHALDEERRHSLAAGMMDHLSKPISPDALYRMIELYGRPAVQEALDVVDALSRVQGNQSLYQSLLSRFRVSYGNVAAEVKDLVANGHRDEALYRAHQVRGLSLNLGMRALGGSLLNIELGLRQGDGVTSAMLETLTDALGRTLDAIASLLDVAPGESQLFFRRYEIPGAPPARRSPNENSESD
jgi:signal transduction histidine kinase/CheY-like chemotaxis protein